jgi:hypothetical protein
MAHEAINDQHAESRQSKHGMDVDAVNGAIIPDACVAASESLESAAPHFVSPQQFYRDALKREDIRHILDALAK